MKTTARKRLIDVTPSARRLTESLRDIGYDFVSAVADVVDNSVSAGAEEVEVNLVFAGPGSYVMISDDGSGMNDSELNEALRFGSRREYGDDQLGRYGLGLKTASLSQCRRLTVLTRTAPSQPRARMRTLDLDHVHDRDLWEILEGPTGDDIEWIDEAIEEIRRGPGTVVIWDKLDRVLPADGPSTGWARRRLDTLATRVAEHLGMVFHRFIEGQVKGRRRLIVTVNGEKIRPWNPFAPDEQQRQELPKRRFEVQVGDVNGYVEFHPYVLPARSLFSSPTEFERLSGPRKWNRQQGFYVYRADRLIQGGGWSGLRAADEHTKLARAAVLFTPSLDDLFRINVAKMRVTLPAEVRTLLEPEASALCKSAERMYRRDARTGRAGSGFDPASLTGRSAAPSAEMGDAGAAILAAAVATDHGPAMLDVIDHLRDSRPDIVKLMEW